MKRSFFLAVLVGSALSWLDPVLAYETPTHERMSQEAAKASILADRLKDIGPDLGLLSLESELSDGGLYFFGFTVFEKSQSILKWIGQGSISEDNWCCPLFRFWNHFYNPLAPAGQEGYSYLGSTGLPSLQWGLEPTNIPGQDNSYRDARNYFYQGIVSSTESERKHNLSQMFRSVGQVVHLVQDLAQPQHTRNDSHATGSRYENYTNRVLSGLTFGGYPSVTVSTPDQFWVTPDGKGMANYSNRGFVTAGTNFTGTRSGNDLVIRPNPNFPLPNGVGAEILRKQITDPDLLGPVGPGQPLQGEMWFVSTPVPDGYLGTPAINPKTSTFSIFDEDLLAIGSDWTLTLNTFNFKEAHKLLIPRAVGYSAGLINYFFRGQMEITPPAERVYGIVDHGTIHQTDPKGFVGFNTVKLEIRNTTPNEEAMSGGKLVAVAKFHRNGCYKDDLTGEFTTASLVPPCNEYRTDPEEIVLSNEFTNVSLGAAAQLFTFTFSRPIPINASDLYLQVVYRGILGNEADAVVVATKDLFEPTYLAWFNSTDQLWWNGIFYETTDPRLLPTFDPQLTGKIDPRYDRTNLDVNFGFTGSLSDPYLGTVTDLPPGRFSRVAMLTDRSPFLLVSAGADRLGYFPLDRRVFNVSPETNQLQFDAATNTSIYYVSQFGQLRGVPYWAPFSFYRAYGTGTIDLTQMPTLTNKTPFPVTTLNFP